MQMVVPQTVRSLTIYNGEVKIIKFTNCFFIWVRVFVGFFRTYDKTYTLYLHSYSQYGFIYSGLYSCSLGYVCEFFLLFLRSFPLNLVILKVNITVLLRGLVLNLNSLSKKYWFVVPMI
jgi:hypothetical protein